MAGNGGARPGAGRKKGQSLEVVRKRRFAVDLMEQHDLSPIEVMMGNMVFWHRQADKLTEKLMEFMQRANPEDPDTINQFNELVKRMLSCRSEAQACAVDAAPYCHPRLAAVAISTDPDSPVSQAITSKIPPKEAADAYARTISS